MEDELYVQHALDVLLVQGGLEEVLISEGVNLFVYFKKFYNNKLWSVDKENHQRNINLLLLLLGALKENGIELEELNQKMFIEGLVAYFKKDSNTGGNSYGGFKIVSE